jgi:hypothetical protein
MVDGHRLRAACGFLGPSAFTAAWVVGTMRQPGYSIANEHISGLAARDARRPEVMAAGFVALGACTVAFADELHQRLGGEGRAGPGPLLLGLAGAATIAGGTLRRDRMSNEPPPDGSGAWQSAENDLHDLSSVIGQTAGVLGLLLLARRFRGDPDFGRWSVPAVAAATANAGLMSWFATDVTRPGNGILQRIGISIPLALMAAMGIRLLRRVPVTEG